MRNRRLKSAAAFGVSILLMLSVAFAQDAKDPAKLLQQGLFEEEANQDLEAAIESYEAVVRHVDEQRRLSATAIFRLGECYRKLGRNEDAAEQYRRIVNQFADQETLARLSRENLQALSIDDAVSPSEETGGLRASADLTPEGRARMRALIEERIAILEEAEARLHRQFESGVVSRDAFLPVQREIFDLRRELVRLEEAAGTTGTESGVEGSIASAEDEKIREIQKMIENSPDLINSAPSGGVPPLHEAAEKGQLKVARFLIEHGAKVNLRWQKRIDWYDNLTPLHIAVLNGHSAMVELLLDAGANLETTAGNSKSTALDMAAFKGFSSVAETLLRHGAKVDGGKERNKSTPLQLAVNYGHLDVVKLLIDHGADVNVGINGGGSSPLFMAAKDGFRDITELLIDAGADPNVREYNDRTPLLEAASSGSLEIVEMLMKADADVNARDEDGKTAVYEAVASSRADILEDLLAAGAAPDARVKEKASNRNRNLRPTPPTALWVEVAKLYSREGVNLAIVRMLLEAGSDPNVTVEQTHDTPLFWAIRDGNSELVSLLLDYGTDPNFENTATGETPLCALDQVENEQERQTIAQLLLKAGAHPGAGMGCAVRRGNPELVKLLIDAGAQVSAKSVNGEPILIEAVDSGSPEIVETLLQAGADVDAQSKSGRTAVFRAVESHRADILKILLAAEPELDLRADGSFPMKAGRRKLMGDPTALMRAVKSRYADEAVDLDIVRMLLEAGANSNLADESNEETPLFWALEAGDAELAALLLEHGADPNVTNSAGQTPLSMVKKMESAADLGVPRFPRLPPAPSKETVKKLRTLLEEHGAR